MAIVLSKPLIVEDNLLALDPTGETIVVARQATEAENILRSQMFAKTTRVLSDEEVGDVRIEQDYNARLLRRKEAYLSLCKIEGIQADGAELFRSGVTADGQRISSGMSETEFNSAWGKLPPEVANAIMEVVYRANPDWNPKRSGE
jgi:hypothetical protein